MYFYSPTFLFIFLPLVVCLTLISGKNVKNYFLLFASWFFYAWGEQEYILVLFTYIVVNFYGGKWIEHPPNQLKIGKKAILALVIIFNIGSLVLFRYSNLLADLTSLIGLGIDKSTLRAAPIGISFFSFQCISYSIDVYRGRVDAQKSFFRLALYISLFPQLIAGPIVRYSEIKDQLDFQPIKFQEFRIGIIRFIEGLAKKVILADSLAIYVDQIYATSPHEMPMTHAWLGAFLFTFQIYFDFSGYSDMAIGIGRMFGYKFPENFKFPSTSLTIRQFWAKWHISLGTFFRDYLYGPLGGRKHGKLRNMINLMIVFAITGLWHGSGWNFLIWGFINGVFVILETYWLNKIWKAKMRYVRMVYSISILAIGAILFRAPDIEYASEYYQRFFGLLPSVDSYVFATPLYSLESIMLYLISAALFYPVIPFIRKKWQIMVANKSATAQPALETLYHYVSAVIYIALLVFSFVLIASKTHNPFIYFQF